MLTKLKTERVYKSKLGVPYYFTHDYCLVIYGMRLRDIRGKDLNYLDYVFNNLMEDYTRSLEFTLGFLSKFLVEGGELKCLTPKQLIDTMEVYLQKVIRNPPSRDLWLQNVYYLNGESYNNLPSYEDVPITEFLEMMRVHMDRVEQERQQYQKAKSGG